MLEHIGIAWIIIFGVGFILREDDKGSEICLMLASGLSGAMLVGHFL